MDGVGKAIMVGSYYGSKSTGVKLDVLVDLSRNTLLSTGDFTSQIAKDDSVQIGSCKDLFVFSLRYEAFNTTRYRDSPTSWEARVKGYTVFKITRIPGLNSISIDFAVSASSSDNYTGSNPTLNVECLQEGLQPLSGSFQLAFGGENLFIIRRENAYLVIVHFNKKIWRSRL